MVTAPQLEPWELKMPSVGENAEELSKGSASFSVAGIKHLEKDNLKEKGLCLTYGSTQITTAGKTR